MYIFLVILAFGKKNSVSSVRTEITENRNTRFLKFLGTDRFLFSKNRISSKTEEPNRTEEPNAHPYLAYNAFGVVLQTGM